MNFTQIGKNRSFGESTFDLSPPFSSWLPHLQFDPRAFTNHTAASRSSTEKSEQGRSSEKEEEEESLTVVHHCPEEGSKEAVKTDEEHQLFTLMLADA